MKSNVTLMITSFGLLDDGEGADLLTHDLPDIAVGRFLFLPPKSQK